MGWSCSGYRQHLLYLATPVTRPVSVWFLPVGFRRGQCLRLTTSKDTTRIARAHQHRNRERHARHAWEGLAGMGILPGHCRVTRGAHIECVEGHYETANIPLSNGSNIMYFCSVFMNIWFCKILRLIYTHSVQWTVSRHNFSVSIGMLEKYSIATFCRTVTSMITILTRSIDTRKWNLVPWVSSAPRV
jgi:hypothetical protein